MAYGWISRTEEPAFRAVIGWTAERLDVIPDALFSTTGAILCVYEEHGPVAEIVAALLFHSYHAEAEVMEITAAALPGRVWLTRGVMSEACKYVFETAACQMIIARTSDRNEPANRLLSRFGTPIVVERGYGRGEHQMIYTLTDDQQRARGAVPVKPKESRLHAKTA